MRIVVTGGAGFIGSHVVDLLVGAGHDVRVLDVFADAAHAGRPDYLHPDAEHVERDVVDVTDRDVAGADAVAHLASRVGLGTDAGEMADYVRDNALGTATVLRALASTGFGGRLVLASSMVVYGEGRYRTTDGRVVTAGRRSPAHLDAGRFEPRDPGTDAELRPIAVHEDTPPDPRSTYAATKLHQEHLCEVFAAERDVAATVLRYHNVYGPRMPRDTPYAGVASIFRSAYEAGRAPTVFEDGRQLRDFVHVHDVARATVLALCGDPPVRGPVNIASGDPRSVGDMACALRAAFDGDAPEPRITGRWRSGDVRHVFADTTRARDELGFVAQVDFDTGMRRFATDPLRDPVGA